MRLWRCGLASYGSSPGRQPTRLPYKVTTTSLNQVVQRVCVMRRPDLSPSIVPREASLDTYLVLEDFGGRLGRAWRETDEESTDRETLIRDLMEEQYRLPVRIVAINTGEGWSRDVTLEIADELRRRFSEYDEVPASVQEFLETASRAR
jgi:hypothetical protein